MSQKIKTSVEIDGSLSASQIANATTDTDKFLVSDGGTIKYRTGAELATDLGISAGTTSKVQHQVKAVVAINKGQAVYVTSADGTNMIVGLASNAAEATSSKTMGLLNATVAANGFADVITEGLLDGLNTIGANAGDPIWLGTGGNLIYGLANKPYAPNHLVFIGIVTRVNANNGEIFVKVQNGFELDEIHDVDLKTTTKVNGHLLGYNGSLWVNKTVAEWLGYTPYNASNPAGYISSYTETDTLQTVTDRGSVTTNPITINSTSLQHLTLNNRFNLIGSENFHISNNAYYSSGFKYKFAGNASKIALNSDNSFVFQTALTGTPDAAVTFENKFWADSAGNALSTGSMRSPIFYDYNDTSYYVDPSSTSVLSSVVLRGASAISFYGAGNGTYNIGSIYSSTSINSWEAPLETDSYTAARVPFILTWRGGYAAKGGLKLTGDASGELGGNVILHAGNYSSYAVPTSRTITINGTSYDLSANRSWTVTANETDTLATVTGRGASTSTLSNFNGGLTATKTAKNAYAIQVKGGLYGAPRLQLYDLAIDSNAFVGLGVDMSGAAYEFSNYFPRTGGNGKWSVGSWAGDFGTGQYVSGYNEKLWVNESGAQFNVSLTDTVDMRAPIFYDSNDTSFYTDPASTSNLNKLRITSAGNSAGGNILMGPAGEGVGKWSYLTGTHYNATSQSKGVSIIGLYASASENAISIGGNIYEANPATEIRFYTHNAITHGTGGSVRMVINSAGNVEANVDMRAPIFYDYNNTAYYVDPSSGSYCNNFTANQFYALGWFRNTTANTGLYNEVNGNHIYSRQGKRWGITGNDAAGSVWLDFYGNHEATYRGSVHADTSNNIGFLANDGGWGIRTVANKNVYVHGNTLYVNADNQSSSNIIMQDSDHGDRQIHCNSNRIGFLNQSGGWGSWCEDNGNWISDTSVQSPIFYDYDNTGYYLNPASLSNVNSIAAGNYIFANAYLETNGPVYGTIFYDNNNRSYYCDPSATSNFIGLTVSNTINGNISGNANTSNTDYLMSDRDFPSGTLIQTSINYNNSEGDPFVLEIKGNSYGNGMPMDVQIQGYIYANTIINTGGYSNGFNVSGIRAIRYNGNLCFWFPTQGYWNGYTVKAYTAYGGRQVNKVTSVTNTGLPTTDKQVNFTPAISLRSDNYRGYSDFTGSVYGTVFYDANDTSYFIDPTASVSGKLNGTLTIGGGAPSNYGEGLRIIDSGSHSVVIFGATGNTGPGRYSFVKTNGDVLEIRNATGGLISSWDQNGYVNFGYVKAASYSLDNGFKISQGGSNYASINSWMYLEGFHGLYASNNGAHFYPNNLTYGAWRIEGSRNGWGGLEFSSGNGNPSLMISGDSNTVGFHNNSYGWQIRWANGTLYSGRNSYGGSDSIVLQEDKWINSKHYGSDGAFYSTIFYDSNNSAFYADPSGTSYINGLNVGGQTWRGDITWNTAVNINVSGESSFDVYTGGTWQVWDINASTPFITCVSGSQVTIGQAGSRGLYVYGSITASGDVTAYSDVRVKENIHTINNALDKVLSLRGVTYTRIDSDDKSEKIGVIAQEVKEILPQVVSEQEDGMLGVSYGNITAVLIEAIKEQQTQIEELKELVNKLINKQ